METRESLGTEKNLITGFIQDNKYISFKGIISGVMSFPICGFINQQSNIRNPVLKCDYISNVMDLKFDSPEILIVPPNYFSTKTSLKDLY
jgi:hypothetical protein